MPKLHAGLDVADKTTAICIIDEAGEIVLETQAETTPEAIATALKPYRRRLGSVGQEAGLKSAWLHKELARAKLPIHSLDPRHAHAALKANLNKTDANDALGIALLLARGIFTTSYVKSDEAVRIRTFLVLRASLLRKAHDLQLCIRMSRKHLGIEAPPTKRKRAAPTSDIDEALVYAMASAVRMSEAAALKAEDLTKIALRIAKDNPVCARLMTIPGVGALTALTFYAAVDDPHRFKSSRDVGAYFGLTPRTYQSGAVSKSGGISHRGDKTTRKALYMAARVLITNSHSACSLRKWGLHLAKAKGARVSYVAVARKLAVLMHHLWVTGQEFDPSR